MAEIFVASKHATKNIAADFSDFTIIFFQSLHHTFDAIKSKPRAVIALVNKALVKFKKNIILSIYIYEISV
jgi:hypothetical protein